MRPLQVGDRVSIRPDGKRGYGLGDVIAVGPVNARVKPCAGGPDITLPHEDVVLTTGQLWLDERGQTTGAVVQTGLAL